MGDKLVFTGTCIEVETLVDYLKAGHAPEGFPTVSREQAEAYLETTIS
ncbi:DUF433 domain-containing protein [Rubrobacter marinus]|uniref:DUF433 domain-containing protein n=2 Tax=Rubrobacter marinus TaxID=2653852 RepID=A0A6G8Q2G7_9ACTN|nr:DUF433 domain-containing protein [Rubrobacter marinus]